MGTILEKLDRLKGTKKSIRQAIINKGVAVSDTVPFAGYAEEILKIKTGGGFNVGVVSARFTVNGTPYENLEVQLISKNDTLTRMTANNGIATFYAEPAEYKLKSLYGTEELILVEAGSNLQFNYDHSTKFGYGDGSLNAVTGGYNTKLLDYKGNAITSTGIGYCAGNLRLDNNTSQVGIGGIYNTFKPLVKGFLDPACEKVVLCNITSNVIGVKTFANSAGNIPSNKYVVYWMDQGPWGGSCSIYDFYITKSGTKYTLKSAVAEGIIQPMVIMLSASTSSSYYFKDILKVYTGGKASNAYSNAMVVFVTKEEIDSFTVTTNGGVEGAVWVAYCDPSYGVFYCE